MKKRLTLLTLVAIAVLAFQIFKSQSNVETETNVKPKSVTDQMVLIPAGKFRMGTDKLSSLDGPDISAQPIHTVYLDAFYIDTHEVTLGDYKEFLLEGGHNSALPAYIDKLCPTDQHPIIGVTWQDAMAYAKWAGKRLPTEAEWEKAARGGLIDNYYPWGNEEPNSTLIHLGEKTRPVGSYAPNAYGLYDMGGNVAEWCLDLWDPDFYADSPKENPFPGRMSIEETVKNYKHILDERVVRGGAAAVAGGTGIDSFVGMRNKADSVEKFSNIGFRCVMGAQ